jgi:anaerobic magnesium-protoporphyrin IX monomethyl ester cyclase
MKWFCLCRVDGIEQGDINLWQAAGCRKVFFGLESGCNDILKLMNKKATTEMAEQTIRLFEQSNIRTAGFFMVGYPGETHRTIEKTFQWALSLPLDEISFTIPYPLPGTRLYSKVAHVKSAPDWRYENENRLLYQSEFDEDYLRKRIEAVNDEFNNKHRSRKVTANRN